MSHTPGPWGARPNDGQIILNGSNAYDIQEIYNDQGGFNPDDVRLMAAAPDLLSAARLANQELIDLGQGSSASPALRALWAAIAKAEGRADDQ